MIIPSHHDDREALYIELIDKCFSTKSDRSNVYSLLKNYYLFGNGSAQQVVEYNKLFAHIDLLSSFLFSGETTQFVVEISDDIDKQMPEFEREMAKKLQPRVTQIWHDSNLDLIFNDALIWALVYGTTLVKLVPLGNKEFSAYVIEPSQFGVLREDITSLDQQEAFAHEFVMTRSEFIRRTKDHGIDLQEKYSSINWGERDRIAEEIPLPMQKLLINSTSPTITGNAMPQSTAQFTFAAAIKEEVCVCHELWVWDDAFNDYRSVTIIDNKVLLFDTVNDNPFVKTEHPFVKICPNTIPTYFWGRSELMYLIPLQEWVNTRVGEIKTLLSKISDPPKSASGFSGVAEEKQAAFDKAGGWLWNGEPTQASITVHTPTHPGDLFAEFHLISDTLFSEMSGIRDLMQGKGESGVRATSHADLLVKVGSSRVKKKAAILEDSADKCGHLILKMMQRYDPTQYKTDQGLPFIANHLSGGAIVKVDAHSSSPIFVEQQIDKAKLLHEAGCTDKEDFIEAVKPQNKDLIIAKLRKREEEEKPLAQIQGLVSSAKPEEATTILDKLKKMFKKGA